MSVCAGRGGGPRLDAQFRHAISARAEAEAGLWLACAHAPDDRPDTRR